MWMCFGQGSQRSKEHPKSGIKYGRDTVTWGSDILNACGELTATDVEVILHQQVDSMKQESQRL